MADLHVVANEAGDHFVGIDVDGTFVPVASVTASRIAQLQERAADLAELAKADDAASVQRHADAAAALPYTTKSTSTGKPSASGKGGES
jgi:hypothetical protein